MRSPSARTPQEAATLGWRGPDIWEIATCKSTRVGGDLHSGPGSSPQSATPVLHLPHRMQLVHSGGVMSFCARQSDRRVPQSPPMTNG